MGVIGAVTDQNQACQWHRSELVRDALQSLADIGLRPGESESGRAVDPLGIGRKTEETDLEFFRQLGEKRAPLRTERGTNEL